MRNIILTLCFATVASVGNLFASVQVGDLYYDLNLKNKTATVTYKSYQSGGQYNKDWNIITANIPETVTYNNVTYSVTGIGESAFFNCTNLTSVNIPNTVTSIGDWAFENCSSLTSVCIPDSVKSIGVFMFHNCSSMTNVTLSNSITSIGKSVFSGCSGLASIEIPNSVSSIGETAFIKCSSLKYVVIGNGVATIGSNAFYDCAGLTQVTCLGETPATIGNNAFNLCTNLSNIYVPCGALEDYKSAWSYYANYIKYPTPEYTISGSISKGQGQVYISGTICDSIVIRVEPNYGYHFVQWNDGLTNNPRTVELTQDTTFTAELDVDRFGECGDGDALTWQYDKPNKQLTISGKGTLNKNYTFGVEAPSEVEKLVVDEGVTTIGNNAFANFSTLKTVEIPASISTIYERAFYNCISLTHIYNYREQPANAYSNTFDGVDKFNCTLHVHAISLELYKASSVWGDFYSIVALDSLPIVDKYTITYLDKDLVPLNSEEITLHLPEAPIIDGFTFLYWQPLAEKIERSVRIQAVYESNQHESTPEIVSNPANPAQKLIRDGNVYILTDDKVYTLQGQLVK